MCVPCVVCVWCVPAPTYHISVMHCRVFPSPISSLQTTRKQRQSARKLNSTRKLLQVAFLCFFPSSAAGTAAAWWDPTENFQAATANVSGLPFDEKWCVSVSVCACKSLRMCVRACVTAWCIHDQELRPFACDVSL